MKRLVALFTLAMTSTLSAQVPAAVPPHAFSLGNDTVLKIQPDGVLRLGDLQMLFDYREAGRSTQQNTTGALPTLSDQPIDSTDQSWALETTFKPKTSVAPLALHQTIERLANHAVRLTVSLSPSREGDTVHSLRYVVRLPEASFAGRRLVLGEKQIQLPDTPTGRFDLATARIDEISIPLEQGTLLLRGPISALVGDNRHYQQSYFSLILESPRPSEPTATSTFTLELSFRPHTYSYLDFRASANMGFADEVAGDRTGGWTDEGKDHDLRSFPIGKQNMAGVPFSIIDPTSNTGRSALVFAGLHRDYFIKTAEIAPPATPLRTLYLLHAFAWDQPKNQLLGTLIATHSDNTQTRIPVHAHLDAANWTAPYDAPNGLLAWRGSTPRFNEIGLNLSRFELPGKPITRLTIEGSGLAVWMIAGITGSPDIIPPSAAAMAKPLIIAPGADWHPLDFEHDVEPESILDFSQLLDAPAGKHGPVVIRNGHFYFENQPERRVRFWGTNLNFNTNYVDRELADRLAIRLARYGYNAARIHHFDALILKSPASSSHDLDEEKLDHLDYLVSRLKAAGLYLSIDLYSARAFPTGEIEELSAPIKAGIKPAVAISPSAQKAWERFALKLLTHRNPYTGLSWAEEPALIGICPINENVLAVTWSADATLAQLYQQRFASWLAEQDLPPLSERDRSLAFARFLSDRQEASRTSIVTFLKTEAGARAPLTDINHRDYKPLTLIRDRLDYVDVHRYWDHPNFVGPEWDLPYLQRDEPALMGAAELPRQLFPTRIPGLPYTTTEFNYTFPNRYRAEAGPLFGAYSAFQDWDGAFRFAYNGGRLDHLTEPSPILSFNSSNDPIATLADRLIALLFLRGDVQASRNLIAFEINPATLFSSPDALGSYSDHFSKLGLVTGLGSIVTGNARPTNQHLLATVTELGGHGTRGVPSFEDTPKLPQQVLDAGLVHPDQFNPTIGRYRSDTGELDLDEQKGRFSVVTPRTEAFMLTKPGTGDGAFLHVLTEGPAMISVSSLDDQPLRTSSRLLILHLTDVQNTGARFRNEQRKILETWGTAPLLVRRGKASITLRLSPSSNNSRLWAVSPSGRRLREIPFSVDAKGLHFIALTVADQTPALAYELEVTR